MLPNDESHYLNKLFNTEIQAALDEINKNHNDCSCEKVDIDYVFGIKVQVDLWLLISIIT